MQQSAETIAVVNNLLHGLRHELGNLAAVLNFDCEALAEAVPSDMERDPLLDLKMSLHDLKMLLARLRTYPQPSSTVARLDLIHVVLSAVETNRMAEQVPINCRLPAQPVWLDGNQSDLNHALFEIVVNACEATLSAKSQLPVEVTLQTEGNAAIITISDNGPGFSISEINEGMPFLPGYTTKTRDGFMRGLGMGLFMANAVVELHHGTICLENRTEGGALVTITLPLSLAQQGR